MIACALLFDSWVLALCKSRAARMHYEQDMKDNVASALRREEGRRPRGSREGGEWINTKSNSQNSPGSSQDVGGEMRR